MSYAAVRQTVGCSRRAGSRSLAEEICGVGTFVRRDLALRPASEHDELRRRLARWLAEAHAAGLSEEEIDAVISVTTVEATAKPHGEIA